MLKPVRIVSSAEKPHSLTNDNECSSPRMKSRKASDLDENAYDSRTPRAFKRSKRVLTPTSSASRTPKTENRNKHIRTTILVINPNGSDQTQLTPGRTRRIGHSNV